MTAFVRALEQFGQPEAIFGDFSKDYKMLLDVPEVNKEKILKMYRDMYDELLNTQLSESNEDLFSTSTVPSTIGMTGIRTPVHFEVDVCVFFTSILQVCASIEYSLQNSLRRNSTTFAEKMDDSC